MNAIPELKPIEIAVVTRPKFDNAHLGTPRRWISDNVEALAQYYKALGDALGNPLAPQNRLGESDADLDCWLLVQHDIESMMRERRAVAS